MEFNSEMLVLAREYRELTQEELARRCGVSRIKIAKIESGLLLPTEQEMHVLSSALGMPAAFFANSDPVIGYGSSAYYYRKKADLSAADRKRIHSVVNIVRLGLKPLLRQVEVESQRKLVKLSVDDYGGSAAKVAQALRTFWKLPDGPVKNLTATIESAGVIVLLCDFGTRSFDATSLWLADMPPMIFISDLIPGDRWRFTLAHELAHLVMHDVPHEQMEDEADVFAAEFLMPAHELKADFARLGQVKMSKLGYRSKNASSEPNQIPREEPTNAKKLLSLFAKDLRFTLDDLAQTLRLPVQDVKKLFDASPWADSSDLQKAPLRLVAS